MDKWKKNMNFQNEWSDRHWFFSHSFIHSFVILLFGRIMFFCMPAFWYLKFVILECFVLFYFMMLTNNEWWRHNMEQQQQQHIINYVEQIEKNGKKNVPEIKSKQNNLRNKNEMNEFTGWWKKNDWVCLSWYVIDWLIDCDHDEMIVIVM